MACAHDPTMRGSRAIDTDGVGVMSLVQPAARVQRPDAIDHQGPDALSYTDHQDPDGGA